MIVCFLFLFFSLKYFAHGLIFFKTLVCSADAATLIEACDMLRGGGSSTAGANAAAPILTRSLLDPKHPEALETAEVVHMRMKEAHGVEVMVTRMEHVRRFSLSFSRCFFFSLLFSFRSSTVILNRSCETRKMRFFTIIVTWIPQANSLVARVHFWASSATKSKRFAPAGCSSVCSETAVCF